MFLENQLLLPSALLESRVIFETLLIQILSDAGYKGL